MKKLLLAATLLTPLLSPLCLAENHSKFLERTIVKSDICISSLKSLVDNKAFNDVKFLVDNSCTIIINQGWISGKDSKMLRPLPGIKKQCKHAFHSLKAKPELKKAAKTFISNSCYPVNPHKFNWDKS